MVKVDKYNLIKAILASNLEEEVKEALVNSLTIVQPFYIPYNQNSKGTGISSTPNVLYSGDKIW